MIVSCDSPFLNFLYLTATAESPLPLQMTKEIASTERLGVFDETRELAIAVGLIVVVSNHDTWRGEGRQFSVKLSVWRVV